MQDTPPPSPASLAAITACTTAGTGVHLSYARMVAAVAVVERSDAVTETGHPSLASLVQELLRMDRGEARRLIRQSRALVAPLPDPLHPDAAAPEPDLPATAAAVRDGAVGADHVEIIEKMMARLHRVGAGVGSGVDGSDGDGSDGDGSVPLPPEVLAEAETQLAGLARHRSPPRAGRGRGAGRGPVRPGRGGTA